MLGRGSRARGACHGNMYVQTSESPEQVLTRLRCSNVNELEELRMLIKVVWKKRANQGLRDVIEQVQREEGKIRKLKDLEGYMGKVAFAKLINKFEW